MNRLAAVLLAVALSAGALFAGGRTLWQEGGVQLCGPSADIPMAATSDSAGGAVVVWTDSRDWPEDIYAQRVDADGLPLWTENGILLCASTGQGYLDVVADGQHGAIAVWSANGLAVQRVSADGSPLWGSNGVMLRPPSDSVMENPALVGDDHGGAIVVWSTYSLDVLLDTLIACRVDSNGTKRWETVVRVDTMGVDPPCLCTDGLGGVIIAWYEYSGYSGHWAVRAQRVDSEGVIKWDAAGVPLCTLATVQYSSGCVDVGGSRFVLGWLDGGGGSWRYRAQMFDLAGNRLWSSTGVPVSGVFNSNATAVGLPTGNAGQSVWLWEENRTGTHDLFAQKLDSSGARCWDTTGVWVGTTDTADGYPFTATVDGRGGAITAWPLFHTDRNSDEYAQHVDSIGNLLWSDTGLAVCRDTNQQRWTPAIVTDGNGGVIVSWLEWRWGLGARICAQRVVDGAWIEETPNAEVRVTDGGATIIRDVLLLPEAASRLPQAASWLLDVSGRKVLALHPGANDVRALAPGVYFIREETQAASLNPRAVLKVILTR
jgi:hypothetical protein